MDHPRSRGVYAKNVLHPLSSGGSSPLARGLPRPPKDIGDFGRIIPARAGFTYDSLQGNFDAADHPRSRGVYAPKDLELKPDAGSSPLARGLPFLPIQGSTQVGIIPARAGFTLGIPTMTYPIRPLLPSLVT